ncbi:hypothetical protein QJQ45_015587 [Haematococcus lacustris]|nr:hypothetical protein QJQ45_015587 [Haematococcus lacustris]
MATRSRIRGLMCSTSKGIRFYDRDVSAALNIRRIAAGPGRPRELSAAQLAGPPRHASPRRCGPGVGTRERQRPAAEVAAAAPAAATVTCFSCHEPIETNNSIAPRKGDVCARESCIGMAATLTYTVFSLGEAQLHQLHAKEGKVCTSDALHGDAVQLFVMGEVAVELFQESPTAFLQELRKGKFNRLISSARDVLHTIAELQLPVESSASMTGVTLLPSATVEGLLVEKRKLELVQPFKLALLKLASQEAARLMAAGEYELALPVALDAVQQGQLLFKPAPALQLFPLYLLAAQANLGLRRAKQCEDFLALASWLAMKEPGLTTNIMKSQLSRLYGQLYAFQVTLILKLTWGRPTLILIFKYYVPSTLMADGSSGGRQDEAVAAFAEDVYYCAVEYGPEDPRTTLGFYNMGKVHQNRGDTTKSLACTNMVVKVWSAVLCRVVLGMSVTQDGLVAEQSAPAELPVGRLQLMEVVDMLLDIGRVRLSLHGSGHSSVADAHFVTALALVQLEERERASEQLEAAAAIYAQAPSPQQTRLVEMARIMLNVI